MQFEGSDSERNVDEFKKIATLGKGSFAIVYKVQSRKTQKFYAMKAIFKDMNYDNQVSMYIKNEIEIMTKVHQKNIIKLFCYFEDEERFYLILELAPNGQLFRRLVGAKGLPENQVAKFFIGTLKAISHLHTFNPPIIHRDLKPENLLLSD